MFDEKRLFKAFSRTTSSRLGRACFFEHDRDVTWSRWPWPLNPSIFFEWFPLLESSNRFAFINNLMTLWDSFRASRWDFPGVRLLPFCRRWQELQEIPFSLSFIVCKQNFAARQRNMRRGGMDRRLLWAKAAVTCRLLFRFSFKTLYMKYYLPG